MRRHPTLRPTRARTVVVASALALSLAVTSAACSSSSKKDSASPTTTGTPSTTEASATSEATTTTAAKKAPDACRVITSEQAGQLIGLKIKSSQASGSGDEQMCQFIADPNGPAGQVSVFIGPGGPKKQLDIDKDTLGHDFTKLDGIGDEAWLESANVFVRKGDLWASINVVSIDAPEQQVQDGLKQLAKVIADQL